MNRETWVIHNLTSQAVEIDGAGIIDGGASKTVEGVVSRERIAQSTYVLSLLQTDSIRIDLKVDGATVETVTSANASTALLPARKADVEAGGVTSVAGKTGVVTLDTDDIDGLDTALAAKAGATTVTNHIANTSNPHSVTASQVGAYTTSQVNDLLATKAETSDLAEVEDSITELANDTNDALATKLPLTGGTLTGSVTVQSPASIGGSKTDTGFNNTYVVDQATAITTNATPTTLFTVAISNGQTMTIEVAVNGTSSDYAHSVGGTMTANFARNNSGTISQVGVTNTILNTTSGDDDLDFDIDIDSGAIRTFVKGQTSRTYHWGAVYRVTKLSHS